MVNNFNTLHYREERTLAFLHDQGEDNKFFINEMVSCALRFGCGPLPSWIFCFSGSLSSPDYSVQ